MVKSTKLYQDSVLIRLRGREAVPMCCWVNTITFIAMTAASLLIKKNMSLDKLDSIKFKALE